MDQVFSVRQVCECIQRMKKMYFVRLWIWKTPMIRSLRVNGVGGKLLIAVQSFYYFR